MILCIVVLTQALLYDAAFGLLYVSFIKYWVFYMIICFPCVHYLLSHGLILWSVFTCKTFLFYSLTAFWRWNLGDRRHGRIWPYILVFEELHHDLDYIYHVAWSLSPSSWFDFRLFMGYFNFFFFCDAYFTHAQGLGISDISYTYFLVLFM